jgi:excisionase family DNA binding protein
MTEDKQRLTVSEAAAVLGISSEAVRTRIHRGTLDSVREGGRVFVVMGQGRTRSNTDMTDDQTALVEALQSQVEYLRGELKVRTEENRRKDHLLAAALERIPPQLEAPPDERESPETVEEAPERAEPRPTARDDQDGAQRRSWWRRLFAE